MTISNQHVVHLNPTQSYMSIISVKLMQKKKESEKEREKVLYKQSKFQP